MTVLAVALLGGFGALTALAVFYFFGGYWRQLWRGKRLALASPNRSIHTEITEKP